MSKIDNIKNLYSQIHKKTKFIAEVANEFNLNPQYVRGHYFAAFWSITDDKQDKIIEMLQNKIAEQNKVIKVG